VGEDTNGKVWREDFLGERPGRRIGDRVGKEGGGLPWEYRAAHETRKKRPGKSLGAIRENENAFSMGKWGARTIPLNQGIIGKLTKEKGADELRKEARRP